MPIPGSHRQTRRVFNMSEKVIWKYQLRSGANEVEMPASAKILTAQMQGEQLVLWALVNPKREKVGRFIFVYGTGEPLPVEPGEYVASVQTHGGAFIWHVVDGGE